MGLLRLSCLGLLAIASLHLSAQDQEDRVGPFAWCRKIYSPDLQDPSTISRLGTLEEASTDDACGWQSGRIDVNGWGGDSQSGVRNFGGIGLVGRPDDEWWIGLELWDVLKYTPTTTGDYTTTRVTNQDLRFRFGYCAANRSDLQVLHAAGPMIGKDTLPYDAIVVELDMRWTSTNGPGSGSWQWTYLKGVPPSCGIWFVPAHVGIDAAQADINNRLADITPVLQQFKPDTGTWRMHLKQGPNGAWIFFVDKNDDGIPDWSVDSFAAGSKAAPTTLSDFRSGLLIGHYPAMGISGGSIGVSQGTVVYKRFPYWPSWSYWSTWTYWPAWPYLPNAGNYPAWPHWNLTNRFLIDPVTLSQPESVSRPRIRVSLNSPAQADMPIRIRAWQHPPTTVSPKLGSDWDGKLYMSDQAYPDQQYRDLSSSADAAPPMISAGSQDIEVELPIEVIDDDFFRKDIKGRSVHLDITVGDLLPTSSSNGDPVWRGDYIIQEDDSLLNGVPTVAQRAICTPTPITDGRATLSVLGQDDGGEANLRYRWSLRSKPDGAPDPAGLDSFINSSGTNAAKVLPIRFGATGTYRFEVLISDRNPLSVVDTVEVVVDGVAVNQAPIITSATATPERAFLSVPTTILFNVVASDPEHEPLSYRWTDDIEGYLSNNQVFGYIFTELGVHRITVTVTDYIGNETSSTISVNVVQVDDTVYIKTATSLLEGNRIYDNKNLVVSSTLTLSGKHQFKSLTIESSGVVTTPAAADSLLLTITDSLVVRGAINMDGRCSNFRTGYVPTGTSGGTHGGYGISAGGGMTNETYGDFFNPVLPGTPGRQNGTTQTIGAYAGGRIDIVAGHVQLSGTITAKGLNGTIGSTIKAAGSGGSIRIECGTFEHRGGYLTVNGGTGTTSGGSYAGGGGGGRIALLCTTATTAIETIRFSALGSDYSTTGTSVAGSGTIFIADKAMGVGTQSTLTIDSRTASISSLATPVFYLDPKAGLRSQAKCPYDFQLQVRTGGSYTVIGDKYAFDADDDDLLTWEEYTHKTGPRKWDTNEDGASDGVAVSLGLDPIDPDSDDDGLDNHREALLGTDPFKKDSDRDGVDDNLDACPLDPAASQKPPPDPADHTPPTIIITTPVAVPLN